MVKIYTDINADTDVQRFAAAAPAWTPLDLGAALKAWWSADDHGTANMTDDGAGLISRWADKVGGMTVTGTTVQRPTWASNSFNSVYAGVTGDGTGNGLASTNLSTIPTGSTAGEIWMMVSYTGPSASTHYALKYGTATATPTERAISHLFSTLDRYRMTDGVTTITDTAITFTGPHIVGSIYSGTTEAGRIDGRDTNPATATIATLATGTVRLRLFANNGTGLSAWWFGPIRHAFITLTLTATQREQIEGWMAWDSGLASLLPSGHPYKSAAP